MSTAEGIKWAENEDVRVVRLVPRSQVWEGSRGRAASRLHLRLLRRLQHGGLRRVDGQFLCGRKPGWYEDPDARSFDHAIRCPRCVELATRCGIDWPEPAEASDPPVTLR